MCRKTDKAPESYQSSEQRMVRCGFSWAESVFQTSGREVAGGADLRAPERAGKPDGHRAAGVSRRIPVRGRSGHEAPSGGWRGVA